MNRKEANIGATPNITFCGEQLKREKKVTYLGVDFDERGSMKPFVDGIFGKCKARIQKLGWMAKHSQFSPKEVMNIMKPLVFSIASYGSITWIGDPKHEHKINQLFGLARRQACRAEPWERTTSLQEKIPDPAHTLSEWAAKIDAKWLSKNENSPLIAESVKKHTQGLKRQGEKAVTASKMKWRRKDEGDEAYTKKKILKPSNTPHFHLSKLAN